MKKAMIVSLITLLLLSLLSTPALARGGHGRGQGGNNNTKRELNTGQRPARQTRFEVCTIADCTVIGPHQHDGVWYCSQTYLRDGTGRGCRRMVP